MTDYYEYIIIEPGRRSGKACIRGMRVAVHEVPGYLAAGVSHEEVLVDFPERIKNDMACMAYAAGYERIL